MCRECIIKKNKIRFVELKIGSWCEKCDNDKDILINCIIFFFISNPNQTLVFDIFNKMQQITKLWIFMEN